MLLEERAILRALLPQKGEVQNEKNISHNSAGRKQSVIQEGVEANNVEGDREKQEGSESCTLRPQADNRDQEDDCLHDRDITALHQDINELERFRSTVHVRRWGWEDAEHSKNWTNEKKGKKNLTNNRKDRGGFHRCRYPNVKRSERQRERFNYQRSQEC